MLPDAHQSISPSQSDRTCIVQNNCINQIIHDVIFRGFLNILAGLTITATATPWYTFNLTLIMAVRAGPLGDGSL